MIRVWETKDPLFEENLRRVRERGRTDQVRIERSVRRILAGIREEGNRALIRFTEAFDGVKLRPTELGVSRAEMKRALASVDAKDLISLKLAARRIGAFHRNQVARSWGWRDAQGVYVGQQIRALDRVGVYVPGGRAAYPSSVLMNVIPARIAGVKEICLVSPASPDGMNPHILAAAAISGVTEMYRIGGAQAIGALAYGTESVERVDKIVGPGNAYVAAAKRLVFGEVGIDSVAGPSEVLVIADGGADPNLVAADLLSQAEHDPMASAICLTPSRALASRISSEISRQLKTLARQAIAKVSIREHGAVIVTRDLKEAIRIANRIAPEHLELVVSSARRWLKHVRHAGAVFLGAYSPESLGDYVAGPNHVLPTGGSARFFSPLGVYDFQKRTSVIQASPRALAGLAGHIIRLAELEGLGAHAEAVRKRVREGAWNERPR